MYSDLKYLKIDLPEDILKLKCNGNFEGTVELIDMRLRKQIPSSMRKRLEIEKEAARIGETIKIHMPLPIYCQQSNIKLIGTRPTTKYIAPSDFPQRTAY